MKLRERQKRILEFIREYIDDHNYPPTIREIGMAAGISSTSVVNYNLERLEEMGMIERNREVSRGLRLIGYEAAGSRNNTHMVPLYGAIAAGTPIPVPDDPEATIESVNIPAELLPRSGDVFALRVQGRSMIDALVDDGDIIVVRSQPSVETGEMAVVEVIEPPEMAGGTLKHFYDYGQQVELRPANPDKTYQPFRLHPSQVRVHGKVVAVVRQYE